MLHGYCPPHRFLPYLSWSEIDALPDKSNTVIVLPAGSIEQHGPHLPCLVDSIIAAGVIGHALARLPAAVPAFALPPITYGKSDEHLHFPGTMTIEGPTLLATVTEIGESVYRAHQVFKWVFQRRATNKRSFLHSCSGRLSACARSSSSNSVRAIRLQAASSRPLSE